MYGATAPSGSWPPSWDASIHPYFQLFSILSSPAVVMYPSGPHPPIWFLVFPLVLWRRSFRLNPFFFGILSSSILIMWPAHPNLILMSSTMFGSLYKLYSSLFHLGRQRNYADCLIIRYSYRPLKTAYCNKHAWYFQQCPSPQAIKLQQFRCVISETSWWILVSDDRYVSHAGNEQNRPLHRGAHWTQTGQTTRLVCKRWRRNSCPCRASNSRSSLVQPLA